MLLNISQDKLQNTENLYSAQQIRKLDRIVIEDHGVSGFELMTKAANFAFHILVKQWPNVKRIHVLCGSGNNAGDGYILAGIAVKRDFKVILSYVSPPENLKGDALLAYQYSQKCNVPCLPFAENKTALLSSNVSPDSDVIVDALLGTGLNTEVRGIYQEVISLCNQSTASILSIDVPSGLSADTGQVQGLAIEADCTTTFIGLKLGLYTGSGPHYSGDIFYTDLEITSDIFQKVPFTAKKLHLPTLQQAVKLRKADTHKGQCGHVLLIGGDHGFGGAIIMAAESAARMGAGLVSVATQSEHVNALLARQPEIMVKSITNTGQLEPLLKQADVIVIGPGLGQSAWSEQMLLFALKSKKKLILDADALNLLCHKSHWLTHTEHIITPHPGEAARLLSLSNVEIQNDRLSAVKALQNKWGGSVLLKGSGSLIAHKNNYITLCPYGNPGMASGGMGDILSGILGALLAQGLSKEHALELGVCLHAYAADIAVKQKGQKGLLATDLIPIARLLLNGFQITTNVKT